MAAIESMPAVPLLPRRAASVDSALRAVLVVDDEEPIRRLLAGILGEAGYLVMQAGTGSEALSVLRTRPVDLLVTDIRLPDIDGIALMQQAFGFDARMTAITMTGYGTVDLAVNAMKAGAADFLTKPFLPDMVLLTVRRLADLRRLRHENAVLKHRLVQTGTVRLQQLALADFGNGGRIEGPDGLTDYERGVAEGERRAAQRMGAAREREQAVLSALAGRLEERWKTLHQSVEDDVASLAFAVASKIVRQIGESNRDLIVEQVRAALAHIPEGGVVHVTVNPSDLAAVESARDRLAQERERAVTLVSSPDPEIAPGGCLVQTTSRMVDATLETQLMRLAQAIRERGGRESR